MPRSPGPTERLSRVHLLRKLYQELSSICSETWTWEVEDETCQYQVLNNLELACFTPAKFARLQSIEHRSQLSPHQDWSCFSIYAMARYSAPCHEKIGQGPVRQKS
ncbi:hypothetical protein H9L39_11728 [Fusarium oxysporum f. sp. albedinis]|nr:hypothetical protein H9L39_11728 [Fusarium oxysporum f. sp. albedinis]